MTDDRDDYGPGDPSFNRAVGIFLLLALVCSVGVLGGLAWLVGLL